MPIQKKYSTLAVMTQSEHEFPDIILAAGVNLVGRLCCRRLESRLELAMVQHCGRCVHNAAVNCFPFPTAVVLKSCPPHKVQEDLEKRVVELPRTGNRAWRCLVPTRTQRWSAEPYELAGPALRPDVDGAACSTKQQSEWQPEDHSAGTATCRQSRRSTG